MRSLVTRGGGGEARGGEACDAGLPGETPAAQRALRP